MAIRILLFAFALEWFGFAHQEGLFDFEFRGMDFQKAVVSIAKLMKKNVIFSAGLESKPVQFSLSDATPQDALKLLLESQGYIAIEKMGALQIISAGDRGPAAAPTIVIPLKNVIAKDLENNVKLFMGDKGTLSVNEQMNAFIVSAPEDRLLRVRQLITELDQESSQVYIEAKLVETSTTFGREFGIEWGNPAVALSGAAGQSGIAVSAAQDAPNFTLRTTASLGAKSAIDMRLNAAEANGEAKVLSSPKITTLNGVAASLSTSLRYNIAVLTTAAASPGTSQTSSISEINSGINLNVTPFIVSGNQVRLNISLTKSDPLESTTGGLPKISESKAQTSLVVKNRQTAAIGGMVTNRETDDVKGVPFLSNLPILGMIFGNYKKAKIFNELIIFMTPTIFVGSRGMNALAPQPIEPEAEPPSEAEALESLKESEVSTAPGLLPGIAQ